VGVKETGARSRLLPLLSADGPKPNAFLNADGVLDIDVRGVVGGVVGFDEDEDGLAMAGCLAEVVGEVLAALSGRTQDLLGDMFVLGAIILPFLPGVDGVVLIAEVRLTFNVDALCGKGLIGLDVLSIGDCSVIEMRLLASPLSSLSSSVLVLSFRRVPTRGGVIGFFG
jgi:hypothetical protein